MTKWLNKNNLSNEHLTAISKHQQGRNYQSPLDTKGNLDEHYREQRATVAQVTHSSWQGTSQGFKAYVYGGADYGQNYLNGAQQQKFFGAYGVRLNDYKMKNNYVDQKRLPNLIPSVK